MSNQSGGGDSASVYFITAIIVLFVLALTIDFYIDYLLVVWRYLRLGQLWLLSWIPGWVPYFGDLPIKDSFQCLLHIDACLGGHNLTSADAKYIDRSTLHAFSWIPGVFFIVMGIRQIMRTESVSTTHDMESLLRQNAPLYPHSEPFVSEHPENAPLHWDRKQPSTAEFGCALSPEKFCLQSPPPGLIGPARKNSAFKRPIWDGDLGFDLDLAERALARQLGSRFIGIEKMPAVAKKIYRQLTRGMTFSESSTRPMLENALKKSPEMRLESDKALVRAVRKIVGENKKNASAYELVNKLLLNDSLEPYFRECLAEKVMYQHGFVITGLMSLLEESRQGGVVAGCELLWVKRESRTYWYALNSVGRKVAFVEGAGPFAHWLIERHLGRPLSHPEVGEAVAGLEIALKMPVRRTLAERVDA